MIKHREIKTKRISVVTDSVNLIIIVSLLVQIFICAEETNDQMTSRLNVMSRVCINYATLRKIGAKEIVRGPRDFFSKRININSNTSGT